MAEEEQKSKAMPKRGNTVSLADIPQDMLDAADPNKPLKFVFKEESYLQYPMEEKYDFAEYELSEFADAFKLCDTMGDKLLTQKQVQMCMEMLGEDQEIIDFIRAVNDVDPEGEGVFSFQRFIDIMIKFRRVPVTSIELVGTFELMDSDKSGSVDAAEVKQLMCSVGHKLTEEEAEAMIAEADHDDSGEIEYEEFAHIILSTQ